MTSNLHTHSHGVLMGSTCTLVHIYSVSLGCQENKYTSAERERVKLHEHACTHVHHKYYCTAFIQ